VSAQSFPDGASVRIGVCDAPLHRGGACCEVVRARLGPSWRTAGALVLCAECLADFVVSPAPVVAHVWAEATDGLYHEVESPDAAHLLLDWVAQGRPFPAEAGW
jgi:hypothetical protein